MTRRTLFASTLLSFLVASSPARADDLDDFIAAELQRQNIPGLALAVIQNGRVVKSQGYGLANLEHRVPVTPETVFQSGSLGKMFTAAAILLLAEDGKLSLQDPIGKHLPANPAHWRDVTIHHLLSHTSGLPDFPYGDPRKFDLRKDYTDAELVAFAAAPKLASAPGEKWVYCNAGYVLLGIIIHRVTGQPYGELLQRRIFQPLDMKSARVIDEASIIPHRAAGYERQGTQLRNQSWVSPVLNTTADGSLYLSIQDLAKWDLALDGLKPLSAAIKTQMWTSAPLKDGTRAPYGYGWRTADFAGHKHVGHDGVWQGFVTVYDRYPEDRVSIILLANAAGTHLDPIRLQAARTYLK